MSETTVDVNILRRKAREWAQKVVTLYNTPAPQNMQAEKEKLLDRARWLKDKIEAITGTLSEFAPLRQTIGGLGLWPVVIGAIGIGAAAAYIAYWVTDYKKFMEKADMQRALMEDGANARQAAEITERTLGDKSIAEKLFNPQAFVPLGLIAIAGLWMWNRSR